MTLRLLCLCLCLFSLVQAEFKTIKLKNDGVFEDEELWAQMELSPGFDTLRYSAKRQELNYAKSSVENLCQLRGFFKCRIQIHEQNQNLFSIDFKAGPQFTISQSILRFEDSAHWERGIELPQDALLDLNGKAYESDGVNELSQELLLYFQNLGYIHSSISQSMSIDSLRRKVSMNYLLSLKSRVRMGEMRIQVERQNPPKTRGLSLDPSIRSLWKIQRGEVVTLSDLYSFRRKLMQTGLFSRVEIKDTLRDSLSDLELYCQEKAPGTLSTKIFYSYDQVHDLGVGFNATHRNVGGAFHQWSTDLILGLRQQRAGLGYAQPLFAGLPLRLDFRPFYEHNKYWDPIQRFNFDKYSFTNRISLSQSLGSMWSWQVNSDLGYRAVDYPSDNALTKLNAPEDRRELQIRIDPSLSFDWVNDPIDPTLGYRFKFNYSNGGAFDQERRFSTGKLSQTLYLPLAPGTSWAGVVETGKFFQGADLIEARSFYQGGFRTLRGYPSLYLQPIFNPVHYTVWDSVQGISKDSVETIQYSESPTFWRFCQELRFPIVPTNDQWKAVLFADYSKIWDLRNPRLKSNSAMSMGPGLRFKLALLNLRIDYAWWKDFDHFSLWEDFSFSRLSIDLSQSI